MNDMRGLFDTTCKILRSVETVDEYKTPTGYTWPEVGQYPCRLSRSRLNMVQRQPAQTVTNVYNILLPFDADVKAGDLVEVNGIKYRCSEPYRPTGHHTEITVTFEGEV